MRGARPERAIAQAIEGDGVIRPGESVLIACSGGPDSIALAAILAGIAKPMELRLVLGHVNHGVRRSAWQDEAVVLRASAALGLPVKIVGLDPPARADEASLRLARYAALSAMAREAGAGAVATAHNAEDQTETLLLALFRGTGPQGLAGMPARRRLAEGVDLARPVLRWERAALLGCVQAAGLPYALDPTNEDPAYRRNAVRAALSALRPLFPGLDAAVARAASLVGAELGGHEEAGLRKQVRETLREQEALRDVDFGHVEAAVRALRSGGSGRFHMKDGIELAIEKGALTVHQKK
ncbi:MAG TPA: tRNA lysidine(34) synthetase TilS [Candidatus Baltobacteraceae bacterium]|jgi:tRNA(Ile)-lysidine synthase